MKICRYITLSLSLCLSISSTTQAFFLRPANNKIYPLQPQESDKDYVFSPDIRSVEFYREGWDLSLPVLELGENLVLILEFDDLSDYGGMYQYTLQHCKSDWSPSDILPSDYLLGFHEGTLRNWESSRNTKVPYSHYRLSIPNEEMKPVISGNYLLKVYREYNPEDLVLTRRFFIVENRVNIEATARRTENLEHFYTHQEIDFTINHPDLAIDDPLRMVRVAVCQNWDWDRANFELEPTYIYPGQLVYDWEEENLFAGVNEFRYFDTKNLKYQSERIEQILTRSQVTNVFLFADPVRSNLSYQFYEDLNGRFFIRWDEAHDSDLEADYVKVHFTMPFDGPLTGGDFYVWGGMTSWTLLPDAKMDFNPATRAYEASILLKQGYYNYQYRFKPDDAPADTSFSEGDHFQTENEYTILVYFSDIRERYDRLVGLRMINSAGKTLR